MRITIIIALLSIVPLAATAQEKSAFTDPAATSSASLPPGGIEKIVPDVLLNREAMITAIAREMRFFRPDTAALLVPVNVTDKDEIKRILGQNAAANPQIVQTRDFCDENFVGQPISFTQTTELLLDDLLYQIHRRFNINFLAGDGIPELPINIRAGNIPWNTLLKSQLFLSGVRATCIGDNTIQLVENEKLPKLQDTAEVKTKFIKLKFLQPSSGGNVDVAGQSSSQSSGGGGQGCGGQGGQGGGAQGGGGSQGCGNFEKLIIEIEKILGIRSLRSSSIGGGGQGGGGIGGGGGAGQEQTTEALRSNRSVSIIPGRNILVVRATDEELDLINEIIVRADRAPFQVIIRGLVYTANDSRLKDLGVTTTIIGEGGRANNGSSGSLLDISPGLFDFSSLIGTIDFNIQANALQTKGIISVKSRPFAMVKDGDTVNLDVGRTIPVLIQAQNSLGNTPGTLNFIAAGNILNVTPQVIDDENGKATGVNLSLQLETNDVDTLVVSQGIPSVNRRSIQTQLLLNQETTVILGGFTVDTKSKDTSKTPGLGDIPILGYLFKRKVKREELNRLYFAISVSIVPYGTIVKPVPDVDTDIPDVPPSVKKVEGDGKKTGN